MERSAIRSVAFGGFDKEDVARYIEQLSQETEKLREERDALQEKADCLEKEADELRTQVQELTKAREELSAEMARLAPLEKENAQLKEQVETLRPDAEAHVMLRGQVGAIECEARQRAAELEEHTAGNLFGLMTLCGISTFIMGALTGGFFGDFLTQVVKLTTGGDFTLPALFTPLDDTLMILIGAMALGMVQIITGMAISFVRKLKNGQVMDAVWEELTWWVVFAGIGLMAAGMTSVVLYVGLAMVVLGPVLTNKGFGKITGIFGSLYNHITGYFGDILSYSRLMALMLAGSVIAQVFNTLGAIPGNIIVFLIISLAGNALNFALNLLGCYVHDLRLQCLEYFGKFYEDGGKPFKPLMADTKYVDITK